MSNLNFKFNFNFQQTDTSQLNTNTSVNQKLDFSVATNIDNSLKMNEFGGSSSSKMESFDLSVDEITTTFDTDTKKTDIEFAKADIENEQSFKLDEAKEVKPFEVTSTESKGLEQTEGANPLSVSEKTSTLDNNLSSDSSNSTTLGTDSASVMGGTNDTTINLNEVSDDTKITIQTADEKGNPVTSTITIGEFKTELKESGFTDTEIKQVFSGEKTIEEIYNEKANTIVIQTTNDKGDPITETMTIDEFKVELKNCGFTDAEIAKVMSGEKTVAEIFDEISNDPKRLKEMMIENYLKSLNLDFKTLYQLDEARMTETYKLQHFEKLKSELENNVEEAAFNQVMMLLNEGYHINDVLNTVIAWKYIDEYGNERYVYDEFSKEESIAYEPVTYNDLYPNGSEHLTDLNKVLIDGRWQGTEEQWDFFTEFQNEVNSRAKAKKDEIKELEKKIQEAKETIEKYEYYKETINHEVDYYLENIDKYTKKPDFEVKCYYDKSAGEVKDRISKMIDEDGIHDLLSGDVSDFHIITISDTEDIVDLISCMLNGDPEVDGYNIIKKDGCVIQVLSDDKNQLIHNYGTWAGLKGEDAIITEQEIQVFNYIKNTQGAQAAYDYLLQISHEIDNRWLAYQTKIDQEFAKEHPFLASIGSILITPFEGIAAACYSTKAVLTGAEIYRTNVYSAGDVYREAVASTINNDTLRFFYNTGMSMADSAVLITIGALTGGVGIPLISAVTMGSRAYVSALNDCLDRGLSDGKAVALAWTSAAVETVMESYSASHLLNLEGKLSQATTNLVSVVASRIEDPKLAKIATKTLYVAASAVSQGFVEGEEELSTEIVNFVCDELIAGELSNHTIAINKYMNYGYSEIEARKMANSDFYDQIKQAFLGGFVSGIFFGSFGAIKTNHAVSKGVAKRIMQEYDGVKINEAEMYANAYESLRLEQVAEEQRAKVERKENLLKLETKIKEKYSNLVELIASKKMPAIKSTNDAKVMNKENYSLIDRFDENMPEVWKELMEEYDSIGTIPFETGMKLEELFFNDDYVIGIHRCGITSATNMIEKGLYLTGDLASGFVNDEIDLGNNISFFTEKNAMNYALMIAGIKTACGYKTFDNSADCLIIAIPKSEVTIDSDGTVVLNPESTIVTNNGINNVLDSSLIAGYVHSDSGNVGEFISNESIKVSEKEVFTESNNDIRNIDSQVMSSRDYEDTDTVYKMIYDYINTIDKTDVRKKDALLFINRLYQNIQNDPNFSCIRTFERKIASFDGYGTVYFPTETIANQKMGTFFHELGHYIFEHNGGAIYTKMMDEQIGLGRAFFMNNNSAQKAYSSLEKIFNEAEKIGENNFLKEIGMSKREFIKMQKDMLIKANYNLELKVRTLDVEAKTMTKLMNNSKKLLDYVAEAIYKEQVNIRSDIYIRSTGYAAVSDIVEAMFLGNIVSDGKTEIDAIGYRHGIKYYENLDVQNKSVLAFHEMIANYTDLKINHPELLQTLSAMFGENYIKFMDSYWTSLMDGTLKVNTMANTNVFKDVEAVMTQDNTMQESTIQKIDLTTIDRTRPKGILSSKTYNQNIIYEDYDYLWQVDATDIPNILEDLQKTEGFKLIEISNTSNLTREILSQIPSDVNIRIVGAYTEEFLGGFKTLDGMINSGKNTIYTKQQLIEIMEEIEKFERGINPAWNDYEKALYAYEYLRDNIKYTDNREDLFIDGISGVRHQRFESLMSLVERESTCQGFAFTYQELLNRMGITCFEIGGKNQSTKHAWNLVMIDEKIFLVDTVAENFSSRKGITSFAPVDITNYNPKNNKGEHSNINSDINSIMDNIQDEKLLSRLVKKPSVLESIKASIYTNKTTPIVITIEGSKFKLDLNENITAKIKEKLGLNYNLDGNGYLKLQGASAATTFEIQKVVCEAILEELETLPLNSEEQEAFNALQKEFLSISKADPTSPVSTYLIKSARNEIGYVYAIVEERIKTETSGITPNEIVETPSEVVSEPLTEEPAHEEIKEVNVTANENISGRIEEAKSLLITFQEKYSDYITKAKIEEAMKSIVVFETDEAFKQKYIELSDNAKDANCVAGFVDSKTGIVYLPPSAKTSTIVHEALHKIATNDLRSGVTEIAVNLSITKYIIKEMTVDQAVCLNEALTDMFTGLIAGEDSNSAYSYGAKFFRKYYDITAANPNDTRFFEAYFKQDIDALYSLIVEITRAIPSYEAFNMNYSNTWIEIINTLEKMQRVSVSGKIPRNYLSKEQLDSYIRRISVRYNTYAEDILGEYARAKARTMNETTEQNVNSKVQKSLFGNKKTIDYSNLTEEQIKELNQKLREIPYEETDTFIESIGYKNLDYQVQLDIIKGVALSEGIKEALINNPLYINYLNTTSMFDLRNAFRNFNDVQIVRILEQLDLSNKNFNGLLDLVKQVSSSKEALMVINQKTNFFDNSLLKYMDLDSILKNISDQDYLLEILTNKNVYEQLKKGFGQYSIYNKIGLLDAEHQIKFLKNTDLLKNITHMSDLNLLLCNLKQEAFDALIKSNPKLKNYMNLETNLNAYEKTNNIEYLNKAQQLIINSASIEQKVLANIIEDGLYKYLTDEEFIKLYRLGNIENNIKYNELQIDSHLNSLLEIVIQSQLSNIGSLSFNTLVKIADKLSDEQKIDLLNKLTYIPAKSLKDVESLFNKEQQEIILSKLDLATALENVNADFVFNYLKEKLANDKGIFKEISEFNSYVFNRCSSLSLTNTIELMKLMDDESKIRFINDDILEIEELRNELLQILANKKELIAKVNKYDVSSLFNYLTEKESYIKYINVEVISEMYLNENFIIDKEILMKEIISRFKEGSFFTVEVFKGLSIEEQINIINNIETIPSSLGSTIIEEINNTENPKQILELVISKIKYNGSIELDLLLSKIPTNTMDLFIKNCSNELLMQSFLKLPMSDIETEIMTRYRNDIRIFNIEDIDKLDYMVSEENRNLIIAEINLKVQELIPGMPYDKYDLLTKAATMSQKAKFLYALQDGLITNEKIDLLLDLKNKNKFILETFDYRLLNDSIFKFGEQFIEKLSKYPEVVDKLVKLQKNETKFNLFANMVLFDETSNNKVSDSKMFELLDYLATNDINENLLNATTKEEIELARNILLKEVDHFYVNEIAYGYIMQGSRKRSIIRLDSINLQNYTEEYNNLCDSLMNNATTVEEAKNIFFNKYLSLTIEDALEISRIYGSDIENVVEYDETKIPTIYIEIINNILSIENLEAVKQFYNEFNETYKMDEILLILDELKQIYTKDIKQALYKPTDIIGYVEYNGTNIPLYGVGDNFKMLVQSTEAYGKGLQIINDNYSDSWNLSNRTANHGICCSLIANDNLGIAPISGNGILIGFTDFSEQQINLMAPYDIYTANDSYEITASRPYLFLSAEEIINNTRHTHNEFNLERINLDGNSEFANIQPSYVIVMEEMSEELKQNAYKASIDFNIPLVYLSKTDIAVKESVKIDALIKEVYETKNLDTLKQILVEHENNRSGLRVTDKEIVAKYFTSDKIETVISDLIKQASSEQLVQIKDILEEEQAKFDTTHEATGRVNEIDIDVESLLKEIESRLN